MAQLIEAMEHDWAGYENIRQLCLNAPKYGNDDEYVDEIYDELSTRVPQILQAQIDPVSRKKPLLFRGAAAGHITIGKYIGALPNGRLAGSPINDAACSVMPGMDVNGPTAAINSATNGPYASEYVGYPMNMKFSKNVLSTPEKIDKLGWLLKAFMKRDGWQYPVQHPQQGRASGCTGASGEPQEPDRPVGRLQRLLYRSAARASGRNCRTHDARGCVEEGSAVAGGKGLRALPGSRLIRKAAAVLRLPAGDIESVRKKIKIYLYEEGRASK
jgi:hypothetical protein